MSALDLSHLKLVRVSVNDEVVAGVLRVHPVLGWTNYLSTTKGHVSGGTIELEDLDPLGGSYIFRDAALFDGALDSGLSHTTIATAELERRILGDSDPLPAPEPWSLGKVMPYAMAYLEEAAQTEGTAE